MLKIKDSNDKVIAILDDEDSEPVFVEQQVEDAKKKKTKKIKKPVGY